MDVHFMKLTLLNQGFARTLRQYDILRCVMFVLPVKKRSAKCSDDFSAVVYISIEAPKKLSKEALPPVHVMSL